ncbi:DUF4331 domain-containing protein [Solirubrobacter phytolaccae]|uniref:DUF4331 domain-containing protein n=1 Tax=Solirubrobacter phytolaccae TaxID=1404360 RepID=A0A9X3NID2_9ACTN|nr:DUF4331 domain-containing protein [Solirubrobacter phytolaccae]MDA0181857.1 DUF4331 domain-containing protein [Solirubrobacter phytolaccae]
MRTALLGAATVAALAAGTLATTGVLGSSHREAPRIMLDPSADNTDLYAFTAPDAPGKVTVISNWVPLQNPAGGPYFGKLDPEARYYIKIDNTGDGVEDVSYRWQFRNTFRNPNSFLYAVPPVNAIGDKNLNFVQTYDLYRGRYRGGKLVSETRIGHNVPVAPDNVGPKTMPNYAAVAAGAVKPLPGGGKTFVGPVDDPFFVDLGSIFDGINIDKPGRAAIGLGNQGGGKDDVSGFNVHSFALQLPAAELTRDGRAVASPTAPNAVVGLWTSTERKAIKVKRGKASERWVQVSRLGNPLINEVVIPIGAKDFYNATAPKDDLKNFGAGALAPEPAKILNALFKLDIKETGRTDVVQALLTGIPGLTQIAPGAVPADTLKFNLGVPASAKPNRFGVLAGDTAGFPNGRRLADDVTDIELRVIAGALLKPEQGGKQIPLGDGIDVNDKPFRDTFPYVALPDSGFDAKFGRVEPAHAPVPQPPTP